MEDRTLKALREFRSVVWAMLETVRYADPDDTLGSCEHLFDEVEASLTKVTKAIGDGFPAPEDMAPETDEDESGERECEMCEGAGYAWIGDEMVACPQCHGTGIQPDDVGPIAEEFGEED